MRAWLGNLSIRTKLMVSFVLIAAIPTIMIFVTVYSISVANSEQITLNNSQTAVNQTAKLIENVLSNCESICAQIATDEEVIAILTENDLEKREELAATIDSKLIKIHKILIPGAYAIYVIGENGMQFKSTAKPFHDGMLKMEMFYWKVFNSRGAYWDGPNSTSWAVDTEDRTFLNVGRQIFGAEGTPIGIVAIEIQEAMISDLLIEETRKNSEDKGLSLDSLCLVDKSFRIVSHPDPAQIGRQVAGSVAYSHDLEAEKRHNSDYITAIKPVGERWMVLGSTYLPDLRQQSTAPFVVVIIELITIIVLVTAMAYLLSHSISNPIKRMTRLMEEVEDGNLDARAKMKYSDEIGVMGRVFNNMLEQLQESIAQIYNKEQQLIMLQYDVLREQIKPHFMYNTLDSVRWLARDGRNKDVERLTLALMKFYRIHLSNGVDIVSLKTEAEHVRNYLDIQKIRYEKEIQEYQINIPEAIADCQMLKVTLQPLVENAIYHGLKNLPSGGSIYISAAYDEDEIIICVEDTGAGIPEERLAALNEGLRANSVTIGYGLRNVAVRLKLMFGEKADFWVESEEGEGTAVYVKVPRIDYCMGEEV